MLLSPSWTKWAGEIVGESREQRGRATLGGVGEEVVVDRAQVIGADLDVQRVDESGACGVRNGLGDVPMPGMSDNGDCTAHAVEAFTA